jgi:hypothetical protein
MEVVDCSINNLVGRPNFQIQISFSDVKKGGTNPLSRYHPRLQCIKVLLESSSRALKNVPRNE